MDGFSAVLLLCIVAAALYLTVAVYLTAAYIYLTLAETVPVTAASAAWLFDTVAPLVVRAVLNSAAVAQVAVLNNLAVAVVEIAGDV